MPLSSLLNLQNQVSSKVLVKISANWSSVLTPFITISPLLTWSLRKWWRISICLVLLCWTWFVAIFTALSFSLHNRRGFVSFKVVVHNNYRWKHIRLRLWIRQCSFISWMTTKQGIFQGIGKHPTCSFYLFCNQHNQNQNSQWEWIEHFWDTISLGLMFASSIVRFA
jgi:VanZ family protein